MRRFSSRRAPSKSRGLVLALMSAAVPACGTLIGLEERHATDPPDASVAKADAMPPSPDDRGPEASLDGDAGARKPETLGQFVEPMLTSSENELLVRDHGSSRSTLLLLAKNDTAHPKTIYDQPRTSALRVVTFGLAGGYAWFTVADGTLWRRGLG